MPGDARQKGGRHKDREQDESRCDNRPRHLPHGALCGLGGSKALFLHHAVNVFHHQDRVVDDEANRQNQRQQRDRVGRISRRQQDNERADQRNGDRQRGDQSSAPLLKENEADGHDDRERDQQGDEDLGNCRPDELCRIVDDPVVKPGREISRQRLQRLKDGVAGIEGIGAGGLVNRQHGGRMPAQARARGIGLGAQLGARDVAQAHDGAVISGLDDDAAEFLGIAEEALGDKGVLGLLPLADRRRPGLPDGGQDVLRADRQRDVAGRDAESRHSQRIHPNSHAVIGAADDLGVADSRDPCYGVDDHRVGIVVDGQFVERCVRREEADGEQKIRRARAHRDTLLRHRGRQPRQRQLHPVLNVDLGYVRIGADLERDAQRVGAGVRRGRRHVEHVLDSVHRRLQRRADSIGDFFGARPRKGCRDCNGWRGDLGILRHRDKQYRKGAGQGRHQGDDDRQPRPSDENPGNQAPGSWAGDGLTCMPGRRRCKPWITTVSLASRPLSTAQPPATRAPVSMSRRDTVLSSSST